jgi:hypothetical protein
MLGKWIKSSLGSRVVRKAQLLFLRRQKHKGFKEASRTKVGLDAIGTSTPLDSNKSHGGVIRQERHGRWCAWRRYTIGLGHY